MKIRDRREWFVQPPTAKGACPDIYAIEPDEQHELINTAASLEEAERIVRDHNIKIKEGK